LFSEAIVSCASEVLPCIESHSVDHDFATDIRLATEASAGVFSAFAPSVEPLKPPFASERFAYPCW